VNCDRIARLYVLGERLLFGRTLERCRTRHLSGLVQSGAALVCGDGDGRFLRELLRSAPGQHVDYVDASRRMTALARRRVRRDYPAGNPYVAFACSDIRDFAPSRAYGLIATHFFLDCFEQDEIDKVVHHIARHATGDAVWLVSEFRIPRHGWAKRVGTAVVAALYAAFRLTTGLRARRLPAYEAALSACGFALVGAAFSCGGLLTSQIWRRADPRVPAGNRETRPDCVM
jgi:SAM-dependent methyltransferase